MRQILSLAMVLLLLSACTAPQTQPDVDPASTDVPNADMPNPASVHCEEQGNRLEIRTAADGSQTGYCIFPDGSECDEWAYLRGECAPASAPTEAPIDPSDYEGWWTYTHAGYGFSIMLPPDWVVEAVTTSDPLVSGHMLVLRPEDIAPEFPAGKERIRLTFRRVGEDVLLWPTGVAQGEFIPQGTLDIAGQPALRVPLFCPTGEVTAIWYHQAEGQANITRGDLEFGLIFNATPLHCETEYSITGKIQRQGEMIIASLQAP
jgi:putative hemolysin